LNDQYHLLIDYPEMKDYLICLDGVSKSLCATGVRVGWMMASNKVIDRATQIFSHIGAWSPKPEQLAVGKFLNMDYAYELFVQTKREQYANIINGFIEVLEKYKNYGFDYVKPDGGIYLSIKLPYRKSTIDLNFFISFLVSECGLGIVPFDYFGTKDSEWFRLSIGGVDPNKLQDNLIHFEEAILKIKKFNEVVRLAD
jgi:aspartate aminotransferase